MSQELVDRIDDLASELGKASRHDIEVGVIATLLDSASRELATIASDVAILSTDHETAVSDARDAEAERDGSERDANRAYEQLSGAEDEVQSLLDDFERGIWTMSEIRAKVGDVDERRPLSLNQLLRASGGGLESESARCRAHLRSGASVAQAALGVQVPRSPMTEEVRPM